MLSSFRKIAAVLILAVMAAPASSQPRVPEPRPIERGGASVSVDVGALFDVARALTTGCRSERRRFQEIRVVATFVADDDGGRATALPVNGPVAAGAARPWRPRAPFLMGPRGQDYVLEWIKHTNRVLANSSASFRLSETDVTYDRIDDTDLNAFTTAEQWNAAQAFFRDKVSRPIPDPRYAGRLVLLFQWGPGSESEGPRGSGLADIDSWFLIMPSRLYGGTQWEGADIPGWYMMPHEFGHFMGLNHPFPDGPTDAGREILERLASGARGLSFGGGYQFQQGGAPGQFAPQPSSAQLLADLAQYNANQTGAAFDRDAAPMERTTILFDGTPFPYTIDGVGDTPGDLGLGWAPAMLAASPCSPRQAAFHGAPYSNVTNRTNVMSYTICDTSGLRYTPAQVSVMEKSLTYPHRAYAAREVTRSVQVCRPLASRVAR